MSPFNLDDYEPVEDRLRAFWKDHPMGRIFTELTFQTPLSGGPPHVFIVKASVWRGIDNATKPAGSDVPPGATGYAQEEVTMRGVNATSALENCETSAIGRALANLGYAAKGKRPSREEMQKASAEVEPRGSDRSEPTTAGMAEADGTGGSSDGEAPVPPVPPQLTDAQRWMQEFHPNKPHKMTRSERVPDLEFCTQQTIGKASCPFAREIARTT